MVGGLLREEVAQRGLTVLIYNKNNKKFSIYLTFESGYQFLWLTRYGYLPPAMLLQVPFKPH